MRFPVAALPLLLAAIFSAVLVVLLLRAGRRNRACVALALFLANAALAQTAYFLAYAQTQTYPYAVFFVIAEAFGTMDGFLATAFGAMLLAERVSVPRALRSFPTFLVPAGALFALTILRPDLAFDTAAFVSQSLKGSAPPGSFPWENPRILLLVDRVSDLAWVVVPILLARWALRDDSRAEWASVLSIAIAMASVFAFYTATDVVDPRLGGSLAWSRAWTLGIVLVNLACQGALVAYLLARALRGPRDRRVFIGGCALVLVGLWAAGAWIGASDFNSFGVQAAFAALITLPLPLIATYALLRHQLLGIDVKLRFAISKSTIAAVFIAVFFIASEAAQQFFGEQFESGYLGILAAGMLVFAIAPLSRVADRLAEKAVPVAMSPLSREENAPPGRSEDAFARAVRLALRGGITRREEHDLAVLADTLGLSAKRALEIREMLEEEVAR